MLVRNGDRTCLEARAKAEPADAVVTADYYTQLPQIRLTGDLTSHPMNPVPPTEVMLDDNDVAKLIECAIRHPAPNMRNAELAAIWNHPDSFRQLFQFGLKAPVSFPEICKIVAEELGKFSPAVESLAANPAKPAVGTLLPRMPLPAHVRPREGQ